MSSSFLSSFHSISLAGGGVEFDALVSPGSSQACVRGIHGTVLKLAVRSPPERGKANDEVEVVLAEFLGVPRRQVLVVGGHAARKKRLRILGLSKDELHAKLLTLAQ